MATADLLSPPEPDFVVPEGYESVDGRLVGIPMSEKSCWVGGGLFALIWLFLQSHPIGRVYPQSTEFRCFPGRPRHVRKPDVAFVRAERLSPELSDRDLQVAPDIVVEVVSPNELVADLNEKISDYRSVNVPLIWIVDPNTRAVQVLRADGTGNFLTESDTLSGEDVLPGFTCRVADFLPPLPAGPPAP
jgi:Uma2 family endonuclease